MSSLIVEICKIESVESHPNADRLEIAHVKGWQCVVPKGMYVPGDLCVYIPPDAILEGRVARHLGVEGYLKHLPKDAFGNRPDAKRVSVAKLRGVPSYGLVISTDEIPQGLVPIEEGWDVAEVLAITKYDPPEPSEDGEAEKEHPLFFKYTDIENIKNYPHIFEEGEPVIFTEKIHGTNVRLGYIRYVQDDQGYGSEREWMAGSHSIRRKYMTKEGRVSDYWKCFEYEGVREMMEMLALRTTDQVMVFGELYGGGVQDLWYGHSAGYKSFAVFDIAIGGKYLDYDSMIYFCNEYNVKTVPLLYRGPFSMNMVEEYTEGDTIVCPPETAGKFTGREGIVIRPEKETISEEMGCRRKILKSISFEYMNRKGATEFH